jgi:hypothetical protein
MLPIAVIKARQQLFFKWHFGERMNLVNMPTGLDSTINALNQLTLQSSNITSLDSSQHVQVLLNNAANLVQKSRLQQTLDSIAVAFLISWCSSHLLPHNAKNHCNTLLNGVPRNK